MHAPRVSDLLITHPQFRLIPFFQTDFSNGVQNRSED